MSFGKAKKQSNKIHIGSRAFDMFLIVFMIIVSIIFLYPFLNVIATSLSSNRMITTGQVTFFPKEFHLDGYKALFKDENILGAYWNTIVIAVGSMIVSLVLNSLMAYVMMAPEFVLRKPLSIILLITMFFSGGTVPTYLLIQNLGLYNSWWSLILPNAVSAYNIFIYRSFYQGISPEIRRLPELTERLSSRSLPRFMCRFPKHCMQPSVCFPLWVYGTATMKHFFTSRILQNSLFRCFFERSYLHPEPQT